MSCRTVTLCCADSCTVFTALVLKMPSSAKDCCDKKLKWPTAQTTLVMAVQPLGLCLTGQEGGFTNVGQQHTLLMRQSTSLEGFSGVSM
ncbi:TPA: hypothetical protein ACH3X3_003957 [Trebouxia sp. C0006]